MVVVVVAQLRCAPAFDGAAHSFIKEMLGKNAPSALNYPKIQLFK